MSFREMAEFGERLRGTGLTAGQLAAMSPLERVAACTCDVLEFERVVRDPLCPACGAAGG